MADSLNLHVDIDGVKSQLTSSTDSINNNVDSFESAISLQLTNATSSINGNTDTRKGELSTQLSNSTTSINGNTDTRKGELSTQLSNSVTSINVNTDTRKGELSTNITDSRDNIKTHVTDKCYAIETKVDTVDSVVDAIKLKTDLIINSNNYTQTTGCSNDLAVTGGTTSSAICNVSGKGFACVTASGKTDVFQLRVYIDNTRYAECRCRSNEAICITPIYFSTNLKIYIQAPEGNVVASVGYVIYTE